MLSPERLASLDERVPEGFADARQRQPGEPQAHLLLIDVDGPEAILTPVRVLLDDGQLHLDDGTHPPQ